MLLALSSAPVLSLSLSVDLQGAGQGLSRVTFDIVFSSRRVLEALNSTRLVLLLLQKQLESVDVPAAAVAV